MAISPETFEIRNLLKSINGIIFLLLLFVYQRSYEHPYISEITIFLGCALILQTHVALSIRRSASDPFVMLLLYYVTIYYSLRIVTLAFFRYSDVFLRFKYDSNDTNYALVFIILSNFCMLIGFYFSESSTRQLRVDYNVDQVITSTIRPWMIILFSSVFACTTGILEQVANYSRLLSVFVQFLRPGILFFPLAIFFITYQEKIHKHYFWILFILMFTFVAYLIIHDGARGYLVYLIELLLIFLFSSEKFSLKRKHVYRGFYLAPLLAVTLVVTYNFASMQRNVHEQDVMAKINRVGTNLYCSLTNGLYGAVTNGDTPFNIDRIFSRVGFFDFSAEVIAHEYQYKDIYNLSYYYKSIIDNVLTPGMDVYDTPKVSNALVFKFLNYNNGVPSKTWANIDGRYHSDQIGIYGELHALFGWYALIIFLLGAYLVKWIYYNSWFADNNFEINLKRSLILFFCVRIFNSFGMDWALTETVPLIVVSCTSLIYVKKRLVNRKL